MSAYKERPSQFQTEELEDNSLKQIATPVERKTEVWSWKLN